MTVVEPQTLLSITFAANGLRQFNHPYIPRAELPTSMYQGSSYCWYQVIVGLPAPRLLHVQSGPRLPPAVTATVLASGWLSPFVRV